MNFCNKQVRYHWVLHHMLIFDSFDSEMTQNYGTTLIVASGIPHNSAKLYPFDSVADCERFTASCTSDATLALPMRPVGCHIFIPPLKSTLFLRVGERCLDGFGHIIRLRLNFYLMSDNLESIYMRLSRYGISPADIPEFAGGWLQFDYKNWLLQEVFKLMLSEGIQIGDEDKYPNLARLLEVISSNEESKQWRS